MKMREGPSPGDQQRLLAFKAIVALRSNYPVNKPLGISEGRWNAMMEHVRREWALAEMEPTPAASGQ